MDQILTSSEISSAAQRTDLKLFSVYKAPIKSTIPYKEVSIHDVYQVIRSTKYKDITEELRKLTGDKLKEQEFKQSKLDYVTFSGTFNTRAEAGLKNHSGLICIDLDDLSDIQYLQQRILKEYTPALIFVSPRGKGLKIVYCIDIEAATHLEYFNAFSAYFKHTLYVDIDRNCKDVSRACYLCYDPNVICSDNPTVLNRSFIDLYQKQENTLNISLPTDKPVWRDIYNKLRIWLDKQESFIEGNRNKYITKLTSACNTYGIPQNELEVLLEEFQQETFTQKEINDTVKSIYNTHSAEHGTKSFDFNIPFNVETLAAEEEKETLPETPLFPIEGFPQFIQDLITECSRVYGTHPDFWAGAILSATAIGIGNTCRLVTKYDNSSILWLTLVAPSGIGKTEPLRFAFKPFHYLDSMEAERYEQAVKEYEINKKKPREEQQDLQTPECKLHILSDATPEAVIQANKINPRGILIERDELHGWLLDFGRYNKSGEVQNWISAWSQTPMTVNRKGQSPLKIENPFINVIGGIQPEILPELAKEHREVNGFLQRFCFIYPDRTIRPYYSNIKLPDNLILAYQQYCNNLLSITDQDQIGLSKDAEDVYTVFINHNTDTINKEKVEYLRAVYSKLDIFCLRFALIIHIMKLVCTGVDENMITLETMQAAIRMTDYFRITGIKVYHKLRISNKYDTKELIKLLSGLGNSQNQISEVLKVSQPYVCKILKTKI